METLNVTCPDCGTVLVVNKKNGKIVEVRKPLLEDGERTGDRFEDARKRVREADQRIEEKVNAAKEAQKTKLDRLEALFKDRKDEIETTGEEIERPDIFRD